MKWKSYPYIIIVTVPEMIPVSIPGGERLPKKKLIFLGSTIIIVAIISIWIGSAINLPTPVAYKNYEGRVFYEIFVRAFKDSNGDGIGDLDGVTAQLDYLEDLGVRGLWLMPITKATSYHGYDTEDYYTIDEDYGTLEDLEVLVKEAHKRDIKVVMDLVINHTSTEHPYFKEARQDAKSPYRAYYIWNDDLSKEFERSPMSTLAWAVNEGQEELYYAMFDKSMPDLNYDNPQVEEEMQKVAKHYLDLGIDGFRLDAAKWIYNEKEKNIDFWNRFQSFVHEQNPEAILIGEVWDAPYNICEYAQVLDSFFDFNVGDSILNAMNNKTLSNVVYNYKTIEEMYKEEDASFVLAPFLTNHDQTRVMNILREDVAKMKVAATIYLSLPGTPFIYYGEEIGMTGTKPDEHIREPFIWSGKDLTQNTTWIDSTNKVEQVALDTQIEDSQSLYHHYKQVIGLRNTHKALSIGTVEEVKTPSQKVFAMERSYEEEQIYVLASISDVEETILLEEGTYKVLLDSQGPTHLTTGENSSNYTHQVTLKPGQIMILSKN
ncbi:alpha-amylase family glycosyl hydrolase [Niameybacter sp.]|uniref:alpha-amylase family glycosyl hydrolase n=1 Tax=Niameybacter sp. TaxID=2033640 RepID=UPI002FCA69F4